MKKNKTVYLFLALLFVWCPVLVGFRYSQQIRNMLPVLLIQVWDKDKPAASTSLRNSNPEMLANQAALESAIAQDHEFSTGGTNSGEHTQIKFNVPISTPTNAANKGWLYTKDVSAVVELHWEDESGNELQLTSGGDLFSSTNLVVTGTSTFNGSITLGAGDDLIGSSTSDITFNTNKFTVAGATGNTLVAGTLDVSGNIDPTTYETTNGGFLDEDNMASDAADKVASQQSIKAFGTMVPAVTGAGTGYAGEESVTFANGLIIKMGVETSIGTNTSVEVTYGTAFPNSYITSIVSINGTGATDIAAPKSRAVVGSETSKLEITNPDGVNPINASWIVIGH